MATSATLASGRLTTPDKCCSSSSLSMRRRSPTTSALVIVAVCCLLHTTTTVAASAAHEETRDDGLQIHYTLRPDACERKARATDVLTLHYKGHIQGSEHTFDSSYERNEPFTFQLGIGHVILGWERGLAGACVGEKRRLVVPPELGYGQAKHDQIPPNSTLIFDLELLKIESGPKPVNVFREIDADHDQRLSRKEMAEFLRKQLAQSNPHGDMGTTDDPDRQQMVDEIFMHEDKDKDDYITHDEFSGPKHDHEEL